MKLHKAIKKLQEGYWIQSELMIKDGRGYLFLEDDKVWFSIDELKYQVGYFFDHTDFDVEWYVYGEI